MLVWRGLLPSPYHIVARGRVRGWAQNWAQPRVQEEGGMHHLFGISVLANRVSQPSEFRDSLQFWSHTLAWRLPGSGPRGSGYIPRLFPALTSSQTGHCSCNGDVSTVATQYMSLTKRAETVALIVCAVN